MSDCQNRNAFTTFAIKLNSEDYCHISGDDDYDDISFSPFYDKNFKYIEKLLKMRHPTELEPVVDIYAKIFVNYNEYITSDNNVSLEIIFKYFRYMLNKFMERKDFFLK